MKRALCFFVIYCLLAGTSLAGIDIVRSNGISLTGADGIHFINTSGITLTGADGVLTYNANGITLTGADGLSLTDPNGVTLTGADGSTYTGPNGITLTGADGITLTGADGITLTGADGITLTGADGVQRTADSVVFRMPSGITLTGADGITLTGADGVTLTGADGMQRISENGITLTGADGITLTGADGITLTGADGITLTGADRVTGFGGDGVIFDQAQPTGITLTGADGITLTGADGITLTGADDVLLRNIDGITLTGADDNTGLQSVDPELAIAINNASDDSSINAVVAYHQQVTDEDIADLQAIGIAGGTRFRKLPMVYVTGTRAQIMAISRLSHVRSIYGNRTLNFDSDPYFTRTMVQRVIPDADLTNRNQGMPVSGRNVTVAVLDTGINAGHADLAGRVVQNVRLLDQQSAPLGFSGPVNIENVQNTDLVAGHGTFVAGVIAASGVKSAGKYSGVAPGAKLVGLSAGDQNLMHVLAGYDYILDKGATYGIRVVNCSFSANTIYDTNDPVNIATRMLTDRGVNVVFSAGNSGPGNGTLNPYSRAPWVVSVGATDQNGALAAFSSRGSFGGADSRPTLVAPGVNIASLRSAPTVSSVGGLGGADAQRLTIGEMPYYTTASGTSFSAPQVAGAIAMMLETRPDLSPAEIKDILSRTATPLPKYFSHETGAGMLNTYAAVLEAAFPDRGMGTFRATLSRNALRFVTTVSQSGTSTVYPGVANVQNVTIPENVVQAAINISWGLSANDMGLKVLYSNDSIAGESNYLNLPGLTGRRESVVLRKPAPQQLRSVVSHTAGTGTAQNVFEAVELTSVEFPDLMDIDSLSPDLKAAVNNSLITNVMSPLGRKFRPSSAISRSDLAEVFVRAGLVSQYLASSPMYQDVRDLPTRNVVESVQSNPGGRLFYDVSAGSKFFPNSKADRLVAAVAFVRAAGLESSAATAALPLGVADAATIPSDLRGYVAVALQRGYLSLHGNKFEPGRSMTRLELTFAITNLIQ